MYELWKVVHITFVVLWMGSMIVAAALPPGMLSDQPVRTLRLLMTIGIVITWIAGLVMAFEGGWFSDPWMHVKLALVTILAGVHGMVVARLRGRAYASADGLVWQSLPWVMIVTVFVVSYLVLIKPF